MINTVLDNTYEAKTMKGVTLKALPRLFRSCLAGGSSERVQGSSLLSKSH